MSIDTVATQTNMSQTNNQSVRLKIVGLNQSFGDTEVLHDINLDAEVNALAIIGPSGGGKSTLLRIIGGLLKPTSGVLELGGEVVPSDENALRLYRASIGFVFQDGGLFHHMNALQNITTPLIAVHGMNEKTALAKSKELLERFGLSEQQDKFPVQLSGGQRQRVAIVRAIAFNPRLILLDEPTSALDPEYTNEVLDVINDLKQTGTKFIIVTHEMGFARNACSDVAFLHDGKLVEYGASEKIFEAPKSSELQKFLGRLLEWQV